MFDLAILLVTLLVSTLAGYVVWRMVQKIAVVTSWVAEIAEYLVSGISWVMSFTVLAKLAEYMGPMLDTFQPLAMMASPAFVPMQAAVPIVNYIPGGKVVTASVSALMAAITICVRSNANDAILP